MKIDCQKTTKETVGDRGAVNPGFVYDERDWKAEEWMDRARNSKSAKTLICSVKPDG